MSGSRNHRLRIGAGALCLALAFPSLSGASLSRNAAGARNMGDSGTFIADTALQLEQEEDGRVWALEVGLQYQVSGRLQLLVEAVPFERADPDGEASVSGIGDTDVTVSWLVAEDGDLVPSVVLGLKAKVPTASDDLGTGRPDYSALLVFEKERGELELSLEAEYATFGSPAGESLKDQLLYTLAAEYSVSDLLAVFAEIFGNSAPIAGESRTDGALLGVELDFSRSEEVAPYLSLEIDTEKVATGRLGVEWAW